MRQGVFQYFLDSGYNRKGNILSVLGDKHSRAQREEEYDGLDVDKLRLALEDKPTIDDLFGSITTTTKRKKHELLARSKGKRSNFPQRAFAIYACHRYSRSEHNTIARILVCLIVVAFLIH